MLNMIFWLVFISFFPPFGIEIWYLILFPYSHLWPLSHYMVLDLYWSTSCNCVRLRGRNCLYLFYVRINVYVMCSFLFGLVWFVLVFTAREEIRDLRVETGRGCCVRFLCTWGQPREIFLGSLRCLVVSE